jgi:hypothetical protein
MHGGKQRLAIETRDAAKDYLARGWSVVPIRPREKRPIVASQPLQKRVPTVALTGRAEDIISEP